MLGDIGYLSPEDQTLLIAQIVEILSVLIVGETDGGRADLADKLDILLMMLGEKSVSYAETVLMA